MMTPQSIIIRAKLMGFNENVPADGNQADPSISFSQGATEDACLPPKALRAAELISLLSMCINSCFCNEIQRRKKGKRTDVESDWA